VLIGQLAVLTFVLFFNREKSSFFFSVTVTCVVRINSELVGEERKLPNAAKVGRARQKCLKD